MGGGTNSNHIGLELRTGENNVIVSWPMIFLQNTMMKGMIEIGVDKVLLHATEP